MRSSQQFLRPCLTAFLTTSIASCISLILPSVASAQPGIDPILVPEASFGEIYGAMRMAEGRYNEINRLRAMKYEKQGDMHTAVAFFAMAARYADKYSQHRLSLAHWHGEGVPVDPVQGYIWADLAAERGHREFLLIRERMWLDLNEDQRAEVLRRGDEFYAEYGDEVAKPRQIGRMLAFARRSTGSRTGYDAESLSISGRPLWGSFGADTGAGTAGADFSYQVTADDLYGEHRVDRHQYWVSQDAVLDWAAQGRVEVGELSETRAD
jgi:hypothetical protein